MNISTRRSGKMSSLKLDQEVLIDGTSYFVIGYIHNYNQRGTTLWLLSIATPDKTAFLQIIQNKNKFTLIKS